MSTVQSWEIMSLAEKIAPDRREKTDLKIGLEVEYPLADGHPLKNEAQSSGNIVSHLNDDGWPLRGRATRDPTVGAEIVSDPPLKVDDAESWYAECIEYIEESYGVQHAPTGMVHNSTAGLHMHISPLTLSEAEKLSEWSSEPWLQVFVCTSICEKEAPHYRVFRDDYCRLQRSVDSGDRYSVVNERSRTRGHYEWRLPEPMTTGHLPYVMEFLKLFKYDPDKAKEYALEVTEKEDITSVKRAEAIGASLEFDRASGEVMRNAHPSSTNFYHDVVDDESCPYIYRVSFPDSDEHYYSFESHRDQEFVIQGVSFNRNTILDAETLSVVGDDEVRRSIERAMSDRDGPDPKEATKYLKDVIDKKKN